ncbi:uncharacterized protein TrAtP1_002040 [Trichoderma atroviride]|uniref:uncharacterized protein n=1 Tax=Hypocrea atroviridis TaxID=63577 RepID=UPI003325B4F7|nr:hypothetical protein TrAtP1_002040 [Trichoderma atroviride]
MSADRRCQIRLPGCLSSPARLGNHRDRQNDSALLLARPLNLAILPRKRLVSHYSRLTDQNRSSPDSYHRKLIFARKLRLISPHPSAASAPRIGPYDSHVPTTEFSFDSLCLPIPPIPLLNLVECCLGAAAKKRCKSRAVVDLQWIRDGAHESGINQ